MSLISRPIVPEQGIRGFRFLLGLFLLVRVLQGLQDADLLRGPGGLSAHAATFADADQQWILSNGIVFGALCLMAIGGSLLIFGRWAQVGAFVAVVPFGTLVARAPSLCDAGDFIARFVLICAVFVRSNAKSVDRNRCPLMTLLSNCFIFIIASQACIIYLSAGWSKLASNVWLNGEALRRLADDPVFTNLVFRTVSATPLISSIIGASVVLHQLLFPVALFTPARRCWVILSTAFHFSIALLMGLFSFSLVMLALDVLFYYSNPISEFFRRSEYSRASLTNGVHRCPL